MSSTGGRPTGSSQDYRAGSAAYEQQPATYERGPAAEPAVYTGAILAGVLMIVGGILSFLSGLAAVINGKFFVYHSNYAYIWSVRNWGWVELIVGAVVVAAGFCVFLGMTWARVVGVIVASLSAIASFMWLPFYPLWGILTLAIDVFIIWALLRYQRA
jgi:hypothetical protein